MNPQNKIRSFILPQVFIYWDHDREPSCHSWRRPNKRIKVKINPLSRIEEYDIERNTRGRGIKRTISTSKTRKITASKKNRVEKGIRAFFLGSKPHSKGDAFSRWKKEEELKRNAMNLTRQARIEEKRIIIRVSIE